MKLKMRFKLHRRRGENGRIIFALCCLLFIPAINNFLNSFLQTGLSVYFLFLTPVSYIFMAFISVFVLYKHILDRRIFVLILFSILLGVLISYVRYPEIRSVIYGSPVDLVYSPVNKLVFFCIPAMIGMIRLSDHAALFHRMRVWARFTAVLGIITYIYVYYVAGKILQYMVYSYFMLLPICVCYEHRRISKSMVDLVIAAVGTVCIVFCGARGAIMSLIFYGVSRVFAGHYQKICARQLIKFLSLATLLIVVLVSYEEILHSVAALLDHYGIKSRFIVSLIESELITDSGRASITDAVMNALRRNPLGYGLFGDRYAIGTYGYSRFTYTHNLFTELLCDFGIVFGAAAILLVFWRIGRTVLRLRGRQELGLMLALLPNGLYQLIFSSSFLESVPFFMIIGACFLVNWNKTAGKCEDN